MWDDPGLAREILEIRPPCLEAKVPNNVEVFFTQYGESSGSASLVLLHKDALLKNIVLKPNQQFVRFDLEVQMPGVINVVVIPEEKDAAVQISSVAPLPVLPATAAQELQKVFENTVDAAKSIVLRKESGPMSGEQQYLLVEGHKLSEGQEQVIRHMLWKERFRPFAADLDFLLNNPIAEASTSPSYEDDSADEGDGHKTVSLELPEHEKTDSLAEKLGYAGSAGDEQADGSTIQELYPTDDPHQMQAMATESYGEVLKGMLKFLSSCDAWSCFFYVVKECNSQGVLFTGIDQSGLSEVGLQGLYELAPQSTEGLGEICDSDTFCANVEELLGVSGPEQCSLKESGVSEGVSLELDGTRAQSDHHLPLNTLPAGHRKSGDLGTESVLLRDSLMAERSSLGDRDIPPLPGGPGTSQRLFGTSKGTEGEIDAVASTRRHPRGEAGHSGDSQAGGKSGYSWHAPSKMTLLKSSSMPVITRESMSTPVDAMGFSYADSKDGENEAIPNRNAQTSWAGTILVNPGSAPDSQLKIFQYFMGDDSISFYARLMMVLICSWLFLIGGSSETDLNVGFFVLGLSGLLIGIPVFGRLLVSYQGLVVLISRIAVLAVFILHAAELLECPCIPSWTRDGRCLGGILQSLVWLAFLSLGFKGYVWRHVLFIALESGAFLAAVSWNDGLCHTNHWLVAGPALLGEVYSITSVVWQRQQLFGGQDMTTAKKDL